VQFQRVTPERLVAEGIETKNALATLDLVCGVLDQILNASFFRLLSVIRSRPAKSQADCD
jgi:hypothetical protein